MTTEKHFYRPDEIAAAVEKPINTIYRWIREGRIEAVRLGGQLKIPSDEFKRLLKHGTRPVATGHP